MCSCFPVIVVLFKGVTETAPVVSLERRSRFCDTSEGLDAGAMHGKPKNVLHGEAEVQQRPDSQEEKMLGFSRVQSSDGLYHACLRANRSSQQSHC